MEDESEAFADAISASIKNSSRPTRPKKTPLKYQDSVNSFEDVCSEEQLSSKCNIYVLVGCNICILSILLLCNLKFICS